MPYENDKDKEIFSETLQQEKSKLVVSVYSYNNGKPKLQIERNLIDSKSNTYIFAKLGRLSKEELTQMLPVINKAMGVM